MAQPASPHSQLSASPLCLHVDCFDTGYACSKSGALDPQFLLEWIGGFGLSATRVELDRAALPFEGSALQTERNEEKLLLSIKEECTVCAQAFDLKEKAYPPHKALMLEGTQRLFEGLGETLPETIPLSQAQSGVVSLSFAQIRQELQLLAQDEEEMDFITMMAHLEKIHSSLSSLLEVLTPFTAEDFPLIYREALRFLPSRLQAWTLCGVHASGMTSIAGIFKAMDRFLGHAPHILYGENTYYECIDTAQWISKAAPLEEATEEEWKEVDLIIAQFNPVWKRTDVPATGYRVEQVGETLHRALHFKQGKPVTVALDCTFDFIDSPRVSQLLEEFQEEIEAGTLNIICFRSGIKFDLFGMDNYCGAPFYMIHNHDPKWAAFELLCTDPVLQTDRLSLNWFCLSYKYATPQLDLYRKQIFDHTRALLNKIPTRLLQNKSIDYRITPFEKEADPVFIDIKIFGPLHQIRGALLVGGSLYLKCLEAGHPIFARASLGFYHPNFSILFDKQSTTVRLTLGLDPSEIDLFAHCFEMIDTLIP